MTNFNYTNISQVDATDTIYLYNEKLAEGLSEEAALKAATVNSRDHSRTPMQWEATENAGFTDGKPWLVINPNYLERNVAAAQADPDSILNLYKYLIQLRHEHQDISDGGIKFLCPDHPTVLAYERGDFLIVTNLSETPTSISFDAPLHDYQDVITQAPVPDQLALSLAGWDYRIYRKNRKIA